MIPLALDPPKDPGKSRRNFILPRQQVSWNVRWDPVKRAWWDFFFKVRKWVGVRETELIFPPIGSGSYSWWDSGPCLNRCVSTLTSTVFSPDLIIYLSARRSGVQFECGFRASADHGETGWHLPPFSIFCYGSPRKPPPDEKEVVHALELFFWIIFHWINIVAATGKTIQGYLFQIISRDNNHIQIKSILNTRGNFIKNMLDYGEIVGIESTTCLTWN